MTCNFAEFYVYDMERPGGEPERILLADLEKEYYRLQFLVDTGSDHLKREMEVSIAAGDIVKVYNDRGTVLCGAKISERILPQSVMVNKGSRSDPIDEGFDRGGNINLISPAGPISKHCYGFAVSGYLVNVEKVSDDEMAQWVKQYPEAFERAYDPASGSHYDGWVEGVA